MVCLKIVLNLRVNPKKKQSHNLIKTRLQEVGQDRRWKLQKKKKKKNQDKDVKKSRLYKN